jgi:RNA polymerase sigma factor (sigma-70 family)
MASLVTDSGRKTPARLAGSAILAVQSDEQLVQLAREGHEHAFDAIVARYRRPLLGFAGRFLPESRTEDAVQQAFINAHSALVGSEEPVNLKPWLFAITRNASLNMVRQNGWSYEQIPADFDGVRQPDQVVEQRIELQRTVAAVNELPDRQRDALVMREFEGRSYDEIALALGANDGAVRQLLNRARGALRAAATLLTPPPLVARAAASLPPSDGRRVAEVFGSIGVAGVAKAGATALVAGTLVVGAVEAPPIVGGSKHGHDRATPKAHDAAHKTPVSHKAVAAGAPTVAGAQGVVGREDHHGSSGHGGSGPGHSGGRHEAEREHSGSGERHHSGSDDGARQPSSSGEHHSGSDDGARTRSGGGTRSGSDDSTHSGSGSGTSGGSGETTTLTRSGETSGGGSDDGLSGTSGSATSGSGTSGSGTSGSGESGSGTSGSGTSGSSDSGTSGSATSGSDDPLTDSH